MKALTKKERDAVALYLTGLTKRDSVMKVYNCKNLKSASALAASVFKRPHVREVLEKGLQKTQEHVVAQAQRSISEELQKLGVDRGQIAKRFRDLLYSDDKRTVAQMLDFYAKLTGAFAPTKQLLLNKTEVYSEIKLLPEEEPAAPNKEEPIKGEIEQ